MALFTSRFLGCATAVALSLAAVEAQAVAIVAARHTNVNHSATTSAFFTLSSDGSTALTGEDGWAPIAPTQAAVATSVTTKKSFSFVGNSTAAGNWVDGNGVPAGITLTFDAAFTITALPTPGSYLTNPGPNATINNDIGRGIGVTQTFGSTGINDINQGAGLEFSPVAVSNVNFTGALAEAGYTFTPGGVSGFGTMLFRSGVFNETIHGMVLTQGADTIGFGTASGSVASGLKMDNNFGPYAGTPVTGSSPFPRQSGPYTLMVTQGAGCIKGLTLGYDVTYDVSAVGAPVNADFNNDDVVDGNDFLIWQRNFGTSAGATLAQGDADGNAAVDAADLAAWKDKFGMTEVTAAVATVPEPASAALAVVMALSVVAVRRRSTAAA